MNEEMSSQPTGRDGAERPVFEVRSIAGFDELRLLLIEARAEAEAFATRRAEAEAALPTAAAESSQPRGLRRLLDRLWARSSARPAPAPRVEPTPAPAVGVVDHDDTQARVALSVEITELRAKLEALEGRRRERHARPEPGARRAEAR